MKTIVLSDITVGVNSSHHGYILLLLLVVMILILQRWSALLVARFTIPNLQIFINTVVFQSLYLAIGVHNKGRV